MDEGINLHRDPYREVESQREDERTYPYGAGQKTLVGVVLLLMVLGLYLLYYGFSSGNAVEAVPGLLLLFGSWISTLNLPNRIYCTRDGLGAYYLFGPSRQIAWQDVAGLSVRRRSLAWAYLRAGNAAMLIPLIPFFGLRDPATLLKTIITRGSLYLKAGGDDRNLEYTRV